MSEALQNSERGYNRELVEQEAMEQAKKIFVERGLDKMSGFEQASSLVNIMQELADEGNHNRHVVEVLAQMTTIIEADNRAHVQKTIHPAAAAALNR